MFYQIRKLPSVDNGDDFTPCAHARHLSLPNAGVGANVVASTVAVAVTVWFVSANCFCWCWLAGASGCLLLSLLHCLPSEVMSHHYPPY
jgi:hypothetical protein